MITIIGVRRRFQWHKISDIFFALLAFFISCLLAYQLQFLWATEFFMKAGAITNNDMVIKAGYVGAGHPYAVTIDRETGQQTRHFVLRDDGAL